MSKTPCKIQTLCIAIIEEVLLSIPITKKGKQTVKTTNIVQVLLPQEHREELVLRCLPCDRLFIGIAAYKTHLVLEKCLQHKALGKLANRKQ